MKHIDMEFVNIQSHEHTKFHLQPGLNFILAEDNNVGKSTIFKVIMCAMQLPKIDQVSPDELIRGGCTSAKAVFTVEDTQYTLWLFREPGRAANAFFETRDADGIVTRSPSAPADLMAAFDIVVSSDGKVVNFNDADSVQLVVQDTPKNDEVLAKVLIDTRVEDIKVNADKLSREIVGDYKVLSARYADSQRVLSSMHHCDAVATFKDEYNMLQAGCRVLDTIEEPASLLMHLPSIKELVGVEILDSVMQLLAQLDEMSGAEDFPVSAYNRTLEEIEPALRVYGIIVDAASGLRPRMSAKVATSMESAETASAVLDKVAVGLAAMSRAFNNGSKAASLEKEMTEIQQAMDLKMTRVMCPVRGEVYYSDEKCIPVSD